MVDPAADLTGDAVRPPPPLPVHMKGNALRSNPLPSSHLQGAEYDFVGIVQVPVVGWDTVELFDGKVAYIPRKLNQILTFLGVALIACAVISFVLHVLGFGPLNARMAFKNAHKQKEARAPPAHRGSPLSTDRGSARELLRFCC